MRFVQHYHRLREAADPSSVIRELGDEDVVQALAAASTQKDPYLANVLATELMNRVGRTRTVLETAGEGVYALDLEGRVTFLNPAAERMLGWSLDELAAKPFDEVVHGASSRAVHGAASTCPTSLEADERVSMADDEFTRRDGSTFPVLYSAAPIVRDDDVTGAVVVFQDASARHEAERRLRESEERHRSLFDNNAAAIFSVGTDGIVASINPAAERIIGSTADEVVGQPFAPLIAPEDRDRALAHFAKSLGGEPQRIDVALMRRDGTRVLVDSMTVPAVVGGSVVGVYGMARDVTLERAEERRHVDREENLRAQNRVLVDLAKSSWLYGGDVNEAVRRITEAAASTLRVARVGIWLYSEDRSAIRCVDLYELGAGSHSAGLELKAERYPGYFAALEEARAIAATDARTDPRTCEFREGYLKPLGIASMLDAPIWLDGRMEGVLCHEHVGERRQWSRDEEAFAAALADLVGRALAAHERRRAEDARRMAEARLRTVVSHADVVIFALDPEGRFTLWEGKGLEPIGLGPGRVVGQSVFDVSRGRPAFARNARRALAGESFTATDEEGERVFEVKWAPMRGPDGVSGVVGVATDVTARRRAEDALRRHRDSLECAVRERTRDLAAANRDLEAFTYSVSHDLRAPLRGIDALGTILIDEHGASLDAEGRDVLRRLRTETARLRALVDDLLGLSHASTVRLERHQVDLSALARGLLAEFAARDPDRRVEATVADGVVANADPALMRVVLENVLGNAWKYTSKEPAARIEFGSTKSAAGESVYFVRDNGVGFDSVDAPRLFQPFQRLHSAADFPGTGVGLATVRRVIARHGGRAWAEGRPREGATFFFTLGSGAEPSGLGGSGDAVERE